MPFNMTLFAPFPYECVAEESARLEPVERQWYAGARAMHASMPDKACPGEQGSCLAATDALYTAVVRWVVRRRWCEALHKAGYQILRGSWHCKQRSRSRHETVCRIFSSVSVA